MSKFQDTIHFIRETFQEANEFIPLHAPVFLGNEKKYLNDCIDSTYVSSVGKYVDQFESEVALFTGAKKAVVCVNGTNALQLALQLAGVKEGDEVITQALTFIATANAISYCYAHPVFLDVDLSTLGLSPDALRGWLENSTEVNEKGCFNKVTKRRIKACVPMHTFGHPVRLSEIKEICEEFKLELVEDAAESIGSSYSGEHTGTFGKVGVLSFNGNKTITTGGGGMLLFNDDELAHKAKHLSTQAKVPHKWEFRHDAIGYNYRMPNINAALGLAQLENLPTILAKKRELADRYRTFFNQNSIEFIKEPEHCQSSYWLNAILLKDAKERDLFLEETNRAGIMTRPIWELMTDLPMFEGCQKDKLKKSTYIKERLVNIPSSYIHEKK